MATGFFVRTSQSVGVVVGPCLDFISENDVQAKIHAATPDSIYGGVRVIIKNGASVVGEFLKKKFLSVDGEECSIHPMTTRLVLHQAVPDSDEEFVRELREVMQEEFGPVVAVSSVPIPSHPEIASGDWKITLDVPEIVDLAVFSNAGLPSDARIHVDSDKAYKLSVQCWVCDGTGHSTLTCPGGEELGDGRSKQALGRKAKGESNTSTGKKPAAGKNADKDELEDFKRKLGQEEVEKYSGKIKIKKEESGDALKDDEVEVVDCLASSKKRRASGDITTASSTTECTENTGGYSFSKDSDPPHAKRLFIKEEELSDDAAPFNYPTSSQLDNSHSTTPSRADSDEEQVPVISKPRAVRGRKRKPITILPVTLPGKIRTIVDEQRNKVLDHNQLEAFFTHAKKKSRIMEVAMMYTKDEEGLKSQLLDIQGKYFASKVTSTPDEIRFMKWFTSFLERIECGPSRTSRRPQKSEMMEEWEPIDSKPLIF